MSGFSAAVASVASFFLHYHRPGRFLASFQVGVNQGLIAGANSKTGRDRWRDREQTASLRAQLAPLMTATAADTAGLIGSRFLVGAPARSLTHCLSICLSVYFSAVCVSAADDNRISWPLMKCLLHCCAHFSWVFLFSLCSLC